jgi:hypothetical protein
MNDNLFWPDISIVIYLVFSVIFCLIVYGASLRRFAWNDPRMGRTYGNGAIRSVNLDAGPADASATFVTNIANSMTPGAASSLLVIGVWLISLVAGATAVPALFGAMPSVSTMNVLLIAVASLCFAFAMARLTVTLIFLTIRMIFILAALGALVFCIFYLITFLAGGKSPVDAILGQVIKNARVMALDISAGSDEGRSFEQRVAFNSCVMRKALSYVGDMNRTRDRCDKNWAETNARLAEENARLEMERYQSAVRQTQLARAENDKIDRWAKQHSYGFKAPMMQPTSQNLSGNWRGWLNCSEGKKYQVIMFTEGNEYTAKGVMHVFRPALNAIYADVKTASTYRVELLSKMNEVELRIEEALSIGEGTPAIIGRFQHQHGILVSLIPKATQPNCNGRLEAAMDDEAVKRKLSFN